MILFPSRYRNNDFKKGLIEESGKDFWERRRLHPEYIRLCENIEFHKSGLPAPKWIGKNKKIIEEKLIKAKERFGIEQIVNPEMNADELNPSIVQTIGVSPVMVRAIAPKDSDIFRAINSGNFHNPARFIEDDKYLTLKIDMTQANIRIIPLVRFYIRYFRQYIERKGVDAGRSHFEKRRRYYRVWEERKQKKSFKAISKKLSIDVDTAKKEFYRAYELIMERSYNPVHYGEIPVQKGDLVRECNTCPIRSECKEACPDIIAYLDQDRVGREVLLQANYHILYAEDKID